MISCCDCRREVIYGQLICGKIWCNDCLNNLKKCVSCSSDQFSNREQKCRQCLFVPKFDQCSKCKKSVKDGTLNEGLFQCLSCRPYPVSTSCSKCVVSEYKPLRDQWGDVVDPFC